MQGDMDIVDPLIDDYLVRLAGSPDPVEAEMRRYADERDGFPIVGQVLGLAKRGHGGLVVAADVLWGGGVAGGEGDAASSGLREYTRLIFGSEGLASTIVPVRDGLAITLKR